MKIWIKYLIAIITGFFLSRYIPESLFSDPGPLLQTISRVILRIGTYLLFPLLFFSMAYGFYSLRIEKRVLPVLLKTLGIILATGILLTLLGLVSVLILSPDRIPVIIESDKIYSFPGPLEIFHSLFPENLFSIFDDAAPFLFPVAFLALLLGFGFSFDKVLARPAVQLFDSFSRVFFYLSRIFTEILSVGMVFVSAALFTRLENTPELDLFRHFFLILIIDTIIIFFIIYPLLFSLLTKERNPYRYLYALLAPAMSAFFSGDSRFTYINLVLHSKENLGVPRPAGAVSLPLFTLFGKAGTAMVTAIGFIILLSSYSSLGIGFQELIWIGLSSFLISFLTPAVPRAGVLAAIAYLCAGYGKGIEEAYLILLPALPVMMSFSVLIDTITAGLGSLVVAHKEENLKHIPAKDFV
jgi:Na+/H+-dicarboxylate symporter